MSTSSLCKPSAYGAGAGAAVGLIAWALVSFVPAFHTGVPQPVVAVLPFALGWAGHVITAWVTPHGAAAAASPQDHGSSGGTAGTPAGTTWAGPGTSTAPPAAGSGIVTG